MKKENSLIGKVLSIDNQAIADEIRTWETKIFPLFDKLITCYRSLNIGEFTNDTLVKLSNNKKQMLVEEYINVNLKDISSPAIKRIVLDSAPGEIDKLFHEWEGLVKLVSEFSVQSIKPILFWDDVSIEEEKPILNKTSIEARYTLAIENNSQAKAYELLLNVKNAYDSLLKHLNKCEFKCDVVSVVFSNSLISFGTDNEMEIDADLLTTIKG